jgi:hypothetical protein
VHAVQFTAPEPLKVSVTESDAHNAPGERDHSAVLIGRTRHAAHSTGPRQRIRDGASMA